MDKQLLKLLKQKRAETYKDQNSILKKFDDHLLKDGIYHSLNQELFSESIRGRADLCEYTLSVYKEAKYDNEKKFLLECLLLMGYNRDALTEMVLRIFMTEKYNDSLWSYADFLYSLKNYKYLRQYLNLIMDKEYGASREMLVLLVGESKNASVVPFLIELSKEKTLLGHVLCALSFYESEEILFLMKKNCNNTKKWISSIAKRYVEKH